MKQRFSSLDVKSLVIDSGFKCYLTNFTRTTAPAPSAFVSRLRKFLRSRRVTSVSQVGTDRIIEIQFSDGQYRLFLEFYASGNIVLADADLSVLALFRNVSEGVDNEQLRVGLKYSLESRQNYHGIPALSRDRIRDGLEATLRKRSEGVSQTRKKGKEKPGDVLRNVVAAAATEFSPMLIDHALRFAQIDLATQPDTIIADEAIFDKIMIALKEAQRIVDEISCSGMKKGYVVAKPAKGVSISSIDHSDPMESVNKGLLKYDDFHPFRPQQFTSRTDIFLIPFEGFNKTVDEFYSSIESQKLETRLTDKEESARKKLENTRLDHEKRIGGLQQVQELNVRKAQAIEANVQRVSEAIGAVNSLLTQGMDWQNVARLIENEQQRHNAVAEIIKLPLKFYENNITLLLAEEDTNDELDFEGNETDSEVSDSDSGSESQAVAAKKPTKTSEDKRLAIDVDLSLSPWSNARQYYDQKKTAAVKEQKTLQSSEKALKSAEKKIGSDLKKELQHEKDLMRPQRKAVWFEKFAYFISSEGYLVLGGKDLQQSEILYNRHLKKGDVYVHADLQGAASIVIKNKAGKPDDPIPPSTLSQAGTLAIATSSAWDSKAVMSAWWVPAYQVSKTASHGDFLQAGNFNIKGEKNFLPPAQLLLGFGLLFKVSEESKARHLKHRVHDDPLLEIQQVKASKEESELESTADGRDNQTTDHQGNSGSDEVDDSGDDSRKDDNVDKHALNEEEDEDKGSDREVVNPLQPGGPQGEDPEAEGEDVLSERADNDDAITEHVSQTGDSDSGIATPDLVDAEGVNPGPRTDGPGSADLAEINTEKAEMPSDSKIQTDTASNPDAKQQQKQSHVRGKHGKRQKQKIKYAHQDEEDRALAMRLLGSAAAQERAKEATEAKASKEQELVEQKERRRKQHLKAAERSKEAEEARRRRFEAGEDGDDGEENEGTDVAVDLDSFIGAPLPGDEILDALVVCGPWDAIGTRCRWRAKLQPGATKKGKAVKEILTRWNALANEEIKRKRGGSGEGNDLMVEEERIRKREAELIKQIRDVEVVGTVPVGKLRVVMGGAEKGGKVVVEGKGRQEAGVGKEGRGSEHKHSCAV
ncbi:uncharacterized protein KY384_002547 [Bacidia gigantensis]|uniref:uncharacterized protein n=1 Tax=Bacidia gigantensis TaxID=2732470 RepID=UPI001D042120|nr:uncharacterized protein KY384_002547 [Bacidia gigantensis]KAG8532670.1 hypothetical protein KY384_002547 [Bacidia gigantensis]